jgi:hypothetical protein
MKVSEREWRSGTYVGTKLVYTEVEPELLQFTHRIRVLPAPHFYTKGVWFELYKRYEPGEHKSWPDGGYHVRDVNGAGYYYDLDQVIVHPSLIEQAKKRIKWGKKKDKELNKSNHNHNPKLSNDNERVKTGTGKRGRPSLTPEEKLIRDESKAQRLSKSGGKRGRPPKDPNAPKSIPANPRPNDSTVIKGKRGRPKLSEADLAKRELDKAIKTEKSGGKRGRPSDPDKKREREKMLAYRLAINPEKKRGRPKMR